MANCRCSNKGVLKTFSHCPYCGGKFTKAEKRYQFEGLSMNHKGYAINTGVKRCPKKGEYYLSGAVPIAYKAPNDLSTAFLIAEVILTE